LSENEIANVIVLKTLRGRDYPGTDSKTTQYRVDDPDETPGHFMITNTLTVKKKRGAVESVRVRTYDSGIQVSQDAVGSIQ
jgi:hypothetical protein